MIYGHKGTIHATEEVNVEVDKDGRVVSVWFRCMALPFTQSNVDDARAKEMRRMYTESGKTRLLAVDVEMEK